ncbi:acetate--CoA ligase family protein [Tabrizicola oligotrophica]|uniref:Acetate--CoA ligase family protein n=1 Tax=Tabrizicola oligotrophica TaxID=2710650 RepID=A0A6M0QWF0_9RHOB|nr:acetate--CoA ligase family protein [Tabrizicola oligotrophica]NEY91798.1 acetate--CoA ligase family protein [Tabrizicola oligotrophica]
MQQINREPQDTLPHRLQPLLAPRSVALVGASRKRNSVGNDMMRNLIPSGYPGAIYPVNPSYDQLYGHACYPSLSALPEAVDLAVLSVPNRVLERVVDEALAVGVKALVIFASAELEGDTDSLLRDRIAAKARAAGIPVCGANCMGFFNPEHPLRAFSAFHPDPIELGGLTYIAQSGSLLQALLFNDERLKFNLAVSTGQELVTSAADFMDYALDQPSTRVIALVLETIRDPQAFIAALEKARARAVPVIVLKLGRTEAGAHFALSHTGAIAGNAEVYEALFRRHGVISVRDLNELAATAILLGTARRAAPGGLAAILDSGGERELIVDCASDLGVPFASISAETTEVLQKTLDSGLTPVNPVDAWGTGKDFEMVFETCLTALMQDADTAIGMFVADLSEELDLHAGYVDVCQAVARATDKPLVVMTNYSAWSHRKHAVRLARSGVAVLDGTAASLRAVRHALEYRDFLARPAAKAQLAENPRASHWRAVLANRITPLTEDEGYALLSDYGIAVPQHRIVESRVAAREAGLELGFPLVAKTAAPGILHKSDIGGVKLGLKDEAALLAAYDDLATRLGPRVLLSAMASGQVEMAFGLVRDPQFGSFVMVAFGGIWIEVLKDSQLAMVPVDSDVAARRIADLKMARVLDGLRGAAPCDRAALIDTYVRLGALAADLGDLIAELDMNPVLVGPGGVVAVDSLIVPVAAHERSATHD